MAQALRDSNRVTTLLAAPTVGTSTLAITGVSLTNATALHIAVVDGSGNQITSFGGSNASVGTNGSAIPTSSTLIGLEDGSGNLQPVSSSNALPVTFATSEVVDSGNSSTSTLLANASFTGTGKDTLGFTSIEVLVYSDQSSAANGVQIQFSSDNSNWDDASTYTFTSGNAAPNTGQVYISGIRARYYRVKYTNGSVNQTAFRLSSVLKTGHPTGETIPMSDVPSTLGSHGLLTKAAIVGKTTAGGGAFVDVKVNPSGALTAAVTAADGDVFVRSNAASTFPVNANQQGTWSVGLNAGTNTIGSVKLTDGTNTASILSGGLLKTALYASDGTALNQSGGDLLVNVQNFAVGTYGNSDGTAANLTSALTFSEGLLYNGSTWDRWRGNSGSANVTPTPNAASTAISLSRQTALSNTAVAIKASSGRIHKVHFYNPNSSAVFVQFYDAAQASVTVGTTTPTWTWYVPAQGAYDDTLTIPIPAGTAITIAATTTVTGGTAPSSALLAEIGYI